MASTITLPVECIINTPAVVAAMTAAKTDIEALQVGSTRVTTVVPAGSTEIMTTAQNQNVVLLDTATGSVCTLPAATGSGRKYKFIVSVLATTASHIVKVANSTDFFVGLVYGARTDSGNAVLGFAAANSGTVATNSDTVTLNRTTTGSVNVGEWIEVEDVATATYSIKGMLSATGAAFATPFSAAV